jgi:hypothetical protein
MTNLMHKFLIYLPIYFCLTYLGFSEDGLKENPKYVRQK